MAQLSFTNADEPGITRIRRGKHFSYCSPDGRRITEPALIARLDAIALPPAYRSCWFNPDPDGHIQATGIDARGRKQYRYHPEFRQTREAEKFALCARFGARLPALRAQVGADLAARDFGKDKAAACVIALLDLSAIRIGSEAYRKTNRTHGAATLLKRHVTVSGPRVRLRFRGKGGTLREVTVTDRAVAAQVRRLQDLPGQRLFQYRDESGEWRTITSCDVNTYIRTHADADLSAKYFRTWHASVIALEQLCAATDGTTIATLSETVAERLGNTPAIARKSYIHPQVLALAETGVPPDLLQGLRRTATMSRTERALLRLLASD
jgi:DNA topoisomerase-1